MLFSDSLFSKKIRRKGYIVIANNFVFWENKGEFCYKRCSIWLRFEITIFIMHHSFYLVASHSLLPTRGPPLKIILYANKSSKSLYISVNYPIIL